MTEIVSRETVSRSLDRRLFLQQTACGLGTVALGHLLSRDGQGAGTSLAAGDRSHPLAPRQPHFPPRARNVIFIFMAGAPSQLDLFDPKPEMRRLHGQPVPGSFLDGLEDPLIKGSAVVFASPRTFRRYGESGTEYSDYVTHLGGVADHACMVRSVYTDVANHHPAQLIMNCGTNLWGHPSFGSWVNWGLGNAADNMPGFVVLLSNSGHGVDGGASLWSNGFLPSIYRGTTFRSSGDPILHLTSPEGVTRKAQSGRLRAVADLNRLRQVRTGDAEIAARMANYQLAYRMQSAGPELLDFSGESQATHRLYGLDAEKTRWFGTNCLLARRMVERGVRFVQLYHSTWDDHSNLNANLKTNCDMTDLPAAGLITDLAQRGLLEDTLVVWGGEFGRTPMHEIRRTSGPGSDGRDHHRFAFSMLFYGGGVRGGTVIGQTDELGYHPTEDAIHAHDLQATMLHCLGFDHELLTYRHQGRDFRLTDVGGNVIEKMLA